MKNLMKNRMNQRMNWPTVDMIRLLPHMMSATLLTFAIACGKAEDRQPVQMIKSGKAQRDGGDIGGMFKGMESGDSEISENLQLLNRLEGASIYTEVDPREPKMVRVKVMMLMAAERDEEPALQIVSEGRVYPSQIKEIQEAFAKKSSQYPELVKATETTLTEESSPEAAASEAKFTVRVFCDLTCDKLHLFVSQVMEANAEDPAKSESQGLQGRMRLGSLHRLMVKSEVSKERPTVSRYVLAAPSPEQLGAGRGRREPKIDPASISRLTFQQAIERRQKENLPVSPSLRERNAPDSKATRSLTPAGGNSENANAAEKVEASELPEFVSAQARENLLPKASPTPEGAVRAN